MKTKYLFPRWCYILGYSLTIPGFAIGYLFLFQNYTIPGFGLRIREKDSLFEKAFENFTNELAIFMVVIGLILIAFSKSKKEDELNARIRLNALHWAVMIYYMCYTIGLFGDFLFGEIPFLSEHINQLNIFTPLLIFVCRFFYLKFINQNMLSKRPKLISHQFKIIGTTLVISSFLGLLVSLREAKYLSLPLLFTYLLFVVGLMLWAFAQQKVEDERVLQQRLESLQLAVYLNYGLLLLLTLLFYSLRFAFVLGFAQFSLLLFYLIRMEYVFYKDAQLLKSTEGGIGS